MKNRFTLSNLIAIKDYKRSGVVLSFTILRFVATCLITNTHYNNVYPIKALAVGGLLGDVLFFVISGFVLTRETNDSFFKWWGKRLLRVYPAVLIGIAIYILTGYRGIEGRNWFTLFVFPTFFAFAGAIMLLYIPFYFINKIKSIKMVYLTGLVVVISYIICFIFMDKSTYRMNDTSDYMIFFLWALGMFIGVIIRRTGIRLKGVGFVLVCVFSTVFSGLYFCLNTIIRNNAEYYKYQLAVPISLLLAVFCISVLFHSLEKYFWKMPDWILKIINFIAGLTLEIYIIQKPIIKQFSDVVFPLNFIIITVLIIISALVLRMLINAIIEAISIAIESIFHKKQQGAR